MAKSQDQNERITFSITEVAGKIGVSSRTVHSLIKDGSLPHARIGTRVLVPADALQQFIEARTQAGKS
jgi:excisionase family DNA binding protein